MSALRKTLPTHADFHKIGVFGVVDPNGETMPETIATTGHSARAQFLRTAHHSWTAALDKGYDVVEFMPVARVVRERDSSEETGDILPGIPTTASGWQMYSSVPGADDAAYQLAKELSALIRAEALSLVSVKDEPRKEASNRVLGAMHKRLDELSRYGTTDGETVDIVYRIVRLAFRPTYEY